LSKAISDLGIKVSSVVGKGPMRFWRLFRNAPSAVEFQKESIERVQKLFTADLLRADKSTMAHGWRLEYRF
jgi:asparagine synthase (glutamine-hydrolysing)